MVGCHACRYPLRSNRRLEHASGPACKASVQKSYRDVTIDRLEKWLDAVERHKPGESDASFGEIRPWGPQEVDELLIDLNTLLILMRNERVTMFFRIEQVRPADASFLHAASGDRLRILGPKREDSQRWEPHPEARSLAAHRHRRTAAFRGQIPTERPPAGSQRLMIYFEDGRRLGFEGASEHWRGPARLLFDKVTPPDSRDDKPDPARDEIVRSWYRVTTAYQQRIQHYERGHLERALELFPDDAELNFFNGCLHETFASRRIQSVFHAVSLPKGVTFIGRSIRNSIGRGSFRGPGNWSRSAEARIRLGHVLGLRGSPFRSGR